MKRVNLFFFVFVFAGLISSAQDQSSTHLFLIKNVGNQIVLEKETIFYGQSNVFTGESILSYVMVFDAGSKSGEIIQSDNNLEAIIAKLNDQIIDITIKYKDGSQKEMPPIDVRKAKDLSLRINVTGNDGYKIAYRIENYSEIIKDNGPVIDMFGGKIPLKVGHYSLLTEAHEAKKGEHLIGEAKLEIINNWMVLNCLLENGKEALFIVDFGADGTVISHEILPESCEIRPFLMVEYSAEGAKSSNAVTQGGSGVVDNILGKTTLETFSFGDVKIEDFDVTVLQSFPEKIRELNISGIIGRDLLEKAELIQVLNLKNESEPLISFYTIQSQMDDYDHKLHLNKAGGHYFIDGKIANSDVKYLMDTGAGKSFLGNQLVEAKGISFIVENEEVGNATGLDGKGMETRTVRVNDIYIGDIHIPKMVFELSDLDIFKTMGLQNDAVLLGMDFFNQYNKIEFAMDAAEVYLWE